MHGNLGSLDSLAGIALDQTMLNTGLGVIACDADGRLTLLSPMLQELFGVGFEPLTEDVLTVVFRLYLEDGVTVMATEQMPIARARAGEYVKDVVVSARDRSGELVFLRCNGAPLEAPDGEPAGAVVIVQEITAERQAAVLAEELRERIVHMVDHEFRTPLAALLGHLEVIRGKREELPPELATSLDAIERSGWRLRDLVCAVADLIEREERLHRAGRTADGAPLATRPVT